MKTESKFEHHTHFLRRQGRPLSTPQPADRSNKINNKPSANPEEDALSRFNEPAIAEKIVVEVEQRRHALDYRATFFSLVNGSADVHLPRDFQLIF